VIFAPEVTPEAGDPVTGEAIWPTLRCARCHGDTASGGPDAPSLRGIYLSFGEFYQQVRAGKADKMPAFSAEEIPDAYLLHVWTWLKQLDTSPPATTAEATTTVMPETTPSAAEPTTPAPTPTAPTLDE
jgi:mono/diheme cytochrome c family protein